MAIPGNISVSMQAMTAKEHDRLHGRKLPVFVYDFEVCVGMDELKKTICAINENNYSLVSVTQREDIYTVFFRRTAHG